mmetsp:Transcript_50320/g.69842  ORF Transcript_50320/g.69842 Transcript_50320/m.69842 type:complete len:113 (+) Transcript_50320:136-474(+)
MFLPSFVILNFLLAHPSLNCHMGHESVSVLLVLVVVVIFLGIAVMYCNKVYGWEFRRCLHRFNVIGWGMVPCSSFTILAFQTYSTFSIVKLVIEELTAPIWKTKVMRRRIGK